MALLKNADFIHNTKHMQYENLKCDETTPLKNSKTSFSSSSRPKLWLFAGPAIISLTLLVLLMTTIYQISSPPIDVLVHSGIPRPS